MTSWQAPKRVRRFQSSYRSTNGVRRMGKMHVGAWYKFWFGREWVPACMTDEQRRKWATYGRIPGRVLTAGATAPINCSKCIEKMRQ